MTPVFLLGSERSGTNLVRVMFDAHSSIVSPPPSGVVEVLPDIAYRYLRQGAVLTPRDLAEDMLALTASHLSPWDVEIEPEDILADQERPSFWGMFRRMNEIYAQARGGSYWLSKEPGLMYHAGSIALHMPDARFVYLVRDGRDVASSMLQLGLHAKNVRSAAHRWAREQRACLSFTSDPLMANRCVAVAYESLVDNPSETMSRLMEFLGLRLEEQQLQSHSAARTREYSGRSAFWSNLSSPINAGSKGSYLRNLSPRQIKVFEGLAWAEMKALEYETRAQHRPSISLFDRLAVHIETLGGKLRFAPTLSPEEEKARSERQAVIHRIKSRAVVN